MPKDPFEQFATLAQALEAQVAGLGLDVTQFTPIIDTTGSGQHLISVMFVLDGPLGDDEPELPATEDDPILAGIMAATAEAEKSAAEEERQALHDLAQAAQEEAIRERAERAMEISERLKRPGQGFLDDD